MLKSANGYYRLLLNSELLLSSFVTLNVQRPSSLGFTWSISWLLMPGSLRRQDIINNDINNYVELINSRLTCGAVLTVCVDRLWRNYINCKFMFMFLLAKLARKWLSAFICTKVEYPHVENDPSKECWNVKIGYWVIICIFDEMQCWFYTADRSQYTLCPQTQ